MFVWGDELRIFPLCHLDPIQHHNFFFFKGLTCSTWKFPGHKSNQSYSCWPIPQPQEHQI